MSKKKIFTLAVSTIIVAIAMVAFLGCSYPTVEEKFEKSRSKVTVCRTDTLNEIKQVVESCVKCDDIFITTILIDGEPCTEAHILQDGKIHVIPIKAEEQRFQLYYALKGLTEATFELPDYSYYNIEGNFIYFVYE